jgi:arginine/lysine/ornithine decarboxylase
VHTAIAAVAGPGRKIAVARDCHLSVITGLVLSGSEPVWLEPTYDDELELVHPPTAATLESALRSQPDVTAVLVCSPSYFGANADIDALAKVAHAHGLTLVVDSAWGLAHAFSDELPPFALACGADVVIGSVHKTMSGLGQTSVLCLVGDRVDAQRIEQFLGLHKSTSTSSILLASIDAARHQMVHDGSRLIARSLAHARRLRDEVAALDGLRLLTAEDVLRWPAIDGFNPQHVTFDVTQLGLTGYEAGDWLRDQQQVDGALFDHRRAMFDITIGDNDESIDRLIGAVQVLVRGRAAQERSAIPELAPPSALRTEQVVSPREAFYARAESVALRAAVGRVSTQVVAPYPPGIPLLVPGERVTREIVDALDQIVCAGGVVEGCSDSSLRTLQVTSGE